MLSLTFNVVTVNCILSQDCFDTDIPPICESNQTHITTEQPFGGREKCGQPEQKSNLDSSIFLIKNKSIKTKESNNAILLSSPRFSRQTNGKRERKRKRGSIGNSKPNQTKSIIALTINK